MSSAGVDRRTRQSPNRPLCCTHIGDLLVLWSLLRDAEQPPGFDYRWRQEYGGLDTTQARKLRELEQENGRLT